MISGTAEQVIRKELMDHAKNPPCYCRLDVWHNLLKFDAVIFGPEGSPYEGGVFPVSVIIPKDYPCSPPKIKFTIEVYHPNIDSDGAICLSVLSDEWKPTMTLKDAFLSISSLMMAPNPDDPFDLDIGDQFKNEREAFDAKARQWTAEYAS